MLLGIDTSGAVSVAVARGAARLPRRDTAPGAPLEILAVRSDTRSRHHDEVLLALVEETLQAAGVERGELTGVVVGRGPGPLHRPARGPGLRPLDRRGARRAAARPELPGRPRPPGPRRPCPPRAARSPSASRSMRAAARSTTPATGARRTARSPDRGAGGGRPRRGRRGADGLRPARRLRHRALPRAAARDRRARARRRRAPAAGRRALAARGEDLTSTEPMYLREPDAAKPTARKSAPGALR